MMNASVTADVVVVVVVVTMPVMFADEWKGWVPAVFIG